MIPCCEYVNEPIRQQSMCNDYDILLLRIVNMFGFQFNIHYATPSFTGFMVDATNQIQSKKNKIFSRTNRKWTRTVVDKVCATEN